MKTTDFSFHLPEELIAQYPPGQRGSSRLLCLNSDSGVIEDRHFHELLQLLKAGDVLVFNNTRVIPARLFGQKQTGGKVELLIERLLTDTTALTQIKASKSPKQGSEIALDSGDIFLVEHREDDLFFIRSQGNMMNILQRAGHMPLPPYIERNDEVNDQSRYQTVYAKKDGAVAAPTAGLHFTENLLEEIQKKSIETAYLTLHVGAGTFQPVRAENIQDHHMHSEVYEIDQQACDKINDAKRNGHRVIAVGTTSIRTLESIAIQGEVKPTKGETDIFIYPGYEFKIVDALITNFHLPESTLLMLVSAFAGRDNIFRAYEHAIKNEYRFFSYGDAMLIT